MSHRFLKKTHFSFLQPCPAVCKTRICTRIPCTCKGIYIPPVFTLFLLSLWKVFLLLPSRAYYPYICFFNSTIIVCLSFLLLLYKLPQTQDPKTTNLFYYSGGDKGPKSLGKVKVLAGLVLSEVLREESISFFN